MNNIVSGVEISNPSKVLYAKENVKKIDVVKYYEKVADRMLPYLNNRLLTVVRCHEKINKDACFYKKHPNYDYVGLGKIKVEKNQDVYFYVKNEVGIINEAQLGTIEFHVWGSTINKLNKPDYMVFDFDPDNKLSIEKVKDGVKHLKSILDELELVSFLKTSGGKGYHVVVPFSEAPSWKKFSEFSKQVALLMESKWPELYTCNIRKIERHGKIFIDYLRNKKGATSVAPYSLRARDKPNVSMPISWSKLDSIKPDDIKLKDALKMIKLKDPWENFFKIKQVLK